MLGWPSWVVLSRSDRFCHGRWATTQVCREVGWRDVVWAWQAEAAEGAGARSGQAMSLLSPGVVVVVSMHRWAPTA